MTDPHAPPTRGARRTLARGAAQVLAVKVVGAAAALGAQLALTNVLGVEGYGRYALALSWIYVLALVGTHGFTTASVRFVALLHAGPVERLRGHVAWVARRVWRASLGAAALLALGVWVGRATALLDDGVLAATFWVACAVLPVWTGVQMRAAWLQGLGRPALGQAPPEIVRNGLLALGALALGAAGLATAPAAMAVQGGAALAALALGTYLLRRFVPRGETQAPSDVDASLWRSTARYMLLIAGFSIILVQADVLMLGALAGTAEAGLYAVASKVAVLLTFVLAPVNARLMPQVADLHARGERGDLQRVTLLAARLSFGAALLGGAVLWIWGEFALGLFGDAFVAARPALLVLIVGQLANTFAGPALALLNMTGGERTSARILGASAVVNLVLNAALIPWLGLVGAAWATAIATAVYNGAAALAVWRRMGIRATAV